MITLITGTPGAGKTLYAISKLLRELVGSVIKSTDENGNEIETPRRILTNIPRLLLDHELIGPDTGGGLADWQEWCKPGDVIVYDEVQRSWPPRPNGSKVPEYISALETHRHKGVDFIIITQNPMLLDRNVLALVGRHLHVRRFGGIGAALVYEWDHCSRQLMYSKALKKSTFRYDKSVFKLYMSAELHTKPKTSVPPLAYVVIAAVAAAAFFIPSTMSRIAGKGDSKPVTQVAAAPSPAASAASSGVPAIPGIPATPSAAGQGSRYDSTAFVPVVSHEPLSAPAYDAIRTVVNLPVIVGGACMSGKCKCYTAQGTDSGISSAQCELRVKSRPFDPYTVAQQTPPVPVPSAAPAPAHVLPSAATVRPMPVGPAINPTAEARSPSVLPPGSPFHTTQPVDEAGHIPPPSLLSPYRRG